jgi:hypothetical protein
MDTAVEPAFNVHKKDGSIMKFIEYRLGLYFYDTCVPESFIRNDVTPHIFLNTVIENKSHFTKRQVGQANAAQALYRKLGHPSEKGFVDLLDNKLLINCPITSEDVKQALMIYGPDVGHLKGTTVEKQGAAVPTVCVFPLTDYIKQNYSQVTLCMDIFHVQGLRFHHSISQNIKFRRVCLLESVTKASLLSICQATIQIYANRGLTIIHIHADGAFACLAQDR